MKFIEYRGPFRLLIPRYDELVLFTMSLTCLLLITTGALSHISEIKLAFPVQFDPRIIVSGAFIAIFIAGLVLSLYHAFIDRPKTKLKNRLCCFLLS